MRYQIKGSTVTFTNQSVNIGDVTGWKWLLDSGSGFAEVATTLNADITFPATAGVTCTVKLLALGPWGATEVKYEEQFMTVENIPGPVIVPKTVSGQSLSTVDTMMEVQAGTGAGQLSWEIIGAAEAYGLSLNQNGRLSGVMLTAASCNFSVKVTDQLGREDFSAVTLTVSSVGSLRAFDLDAPGTVVYDPATMKVSGLVAQDGNVFFSASPSVNQPIFIPDDGNGKACIEFSEDAHGLQFSYARGVLNTVFRGHFCGRVRMIGNAPPTAGAGIMRAMSYSAGAAVGFNDLKRSGALSFTQICASGTYAVPAINSAQTHGFPSNADFILTLHCGSTTPVATVYQSVTRFNGSAPAPGNTLGALQAPYLNNTSHTVFLFLGSSLTAPSNAAPGDRFRLYSFIVWFSDGSAAQPNATTVNDITQFYAKKYGIPCKKITSLTA